MAMSCGAQDIIHLRSLLQDLGEKVAAPTPLFADNEGAIAVAHNPQHHNRVKHIDIRHHFVRECALIGDICVIHVPTQLELADLMTKPLDQPTFDHLRNMLGLHPVVV